jgi:hypothetical protein
MVTLDGPVNRLPSEIIFFAGNLKPKNVLDATWRTEVLQIRHQESEQESYESLDLSH